MTSPATSRSRLEGPVGAPLVGRTAAPQQESRHGPVAQLLIAWSPLSAILVAYWVAQWIAAPLGTGRRVEVAALPYGRAYIGAVRP